MPDEGIPRSAGVEVPVGFALAILGYSALGAALMPRGGFWVMIAGILAVLLL